MARRVPKALVHPDGELFCIHGPKGYYSPIICDDDFPAMPTERDLRNKSVIDLETLRWVPVRIVTERVVTDETALGPYDDGEYEDQ